MAPQLLLVRERHESGGLFFDGKFSFNATMEELSADEKRRVLRERRQAKMAAKSGDRLNTILSSGGSVKLAPPPAAAPETPPVPASAPAPAATAEDDPADVVLSHSAPVTVAPADEQPPDFDEVLSKLFGAPAGAAGAAASNATAQGAADADPFAMMMQMLGEGATGGGLGAAGPDTAAPADAAAAAAQYEHRRTHARFLMVRYLATLANFVYHYLDGYALQASLHSYIRAALLNSSRFFAWFVTCEVAILAAYFLSARHHAAAQNNFVLRGMSMVAMVVPQVQRYRPAVAAALRYWEVLGMVVADVALVVVLFGITSARG